MAGMPTQEELFDLYRKNNPVRRNVTGMPLGEGFTPYKQKDQTGSELVTGLGSLFNAEGPDAPGTMISIPGADFSPGGRMASIQSLVENLNFDSDLALESYIKDISERTMGYEDLSIPVEGLVPDEGGLFGGGGPFLTPSGQQFNFGDDISGMREAYDIIQDNAALPRFDQGMGTGSLAQDKILEAEAAEIDALLENDPVFDDPMADIGSFIKETGGRGNINEKPGDRKKYDAEQFRKKEEELVNAQGGLNSSPISKKQAENNAEKAFMAGMDDFILAARGENPKGPDKKTIEQYKQEFSDATGIDVSGKVNKSQALMAMGLALMQNKGGNIFTEIGIAGEKALPELAAARREAKQAGLSAGKFALEMQSSDEAKRKTAAEKAMNRAKYYVMPKGEGVRGLIKNIDKAKSQRLNVFELNALTSNPEFDENFEIISAASYTDIAKKVLEGPEAVEDFASTKTPMRLFEGENVNSIFTLSIFDVNPNNPDAPEVGRLSGGIDSADQIYRELIDDLKSVNRADADLAKAASLATDGSANTGEMIVNWAKGIANKVGFEVEGNTTTAQLNFFLNRMATENATAILGESGKTLSDGDRTRVDQLIGQLRTIGGDDPDALAAKLAQFRKTIVVEKRRAILSAFRTLDKYSRQDYSELYSDGDFSEEDEAELLKRRKARDKKDT